MQNRLAVEIFHVPISRNSGFSLVIQKPDGVSPIIYISTLLGKLRFIVHFFTFSRIPSCVPNRWGSGKGVGPIKLTFTNEIFEI